MSEPLHPEQSETPARPGAPDAEPGYLDERGLNRWLVRLLKGIAVGIGFILPGLSGGVLAVIFKIYDPMIKFLANIRHRFIDNVRYFIPVGIGGVIGVVLFSIVVAAAFGRFEAQFVALFIGFVIGTFPSLFRTAGEKGRAVQHLLIMAASAAFIFALMLFGGGLNLQVEPSIGAWLGSGALIGLGVIVPGMSPSNFLIYFGLYDKMANGIKDFDFAVIIPLFLGLVACVLLFAKAINWMFQQHYAGMYHFILGTVIGSSLAIFPTVVFPAYTAEGLAEAQITFWPAVLFGVGMLVAGIIASWLFSKVEDKYADERSAIEAR